MLKLTIPDVDNLYADSLKHPRVLKVVALSGGYSRDEANKRLARQHGMIASFSRALTEGLTAQQSRCGVQRGAGQVDREHLPGVEDLIGRRRQAWPGRSAAVSFVKPVAAAFTCAPARPRR